MPEAAPLKSCSTLPRVKWVGAHWVCPGVCLCWCVVQLLPALQEQAQNLQLQYRNTGGEVWNTAATQSHWWQVSGDSVAAWWLSQFFSQHGLLTELLGGQATRLQCSASLALLACRHACVRCFAAACCTLCAACRARGWGLSLIHI